MAKPITWRNIAAPSFGTGAIGTAVDAFRSAAGGFSDLTQSLFQTQDRIDKGYTNESIKRSLETGQIDPNLNPRADATQVWEALLGKRKADSDLLTAESTRAKTRADTDYTIQNTKKLEFENTPEWQNATLNEKKAQVDYWEAQAKNATERNRLEALRIKLLEDERNLQNTTRENLLRADTDFNTQVQARAAQILPEQIGQTQQNYGNAIRANVEKMIEDGATEDEINAAVRLWSSDAQQGFQVVNDLARQRASEQVVSSLAADPSRAAALGLTAEQYSQTTPGRLIDKIQAEQLRIAGERQEAADELAKYEKTTLNNAASGSNTTAIIMDPEAPQGYRVGTAEEAKGNKADIGEYRAIIEEAGLTKTLGPKKKGDPDVIKTVFDYTGGNKSILRNLLKLPGLTKDGFRQLALDYQDGLVNYSKDARVAALRQASELPVQLSGVQGRLANQAADEEFLREGEPTPSVITSTEDPVIRNRAVEVLREIQQLRAARPNMDPRQARILDRTESIVKQGRVTAKNAAFTSRDLVKTYDDEEILKEIESWDQYMTRNGYK